MMKERITLRDANFSNWKEWLSRYGAELFIFSAVFSIAILAGRPEDIPGNNLLRCFFKEWTGLPCPSCGLTRGFIALFHANFAEALRMNAITYILAALFAYRLLRSACATLFRKYPVIHLPLPLTFVIFAICAIYALGRIILETGVKYQYFQ